MKQDWMIMRGWSEKQKDNLIVFFFLSEATLANGNHTHSIHSLY
jgi:hypothetical protein